MPDNVFCKSLFRSEDCAKHRITRQEKQQPTALRVETTDLACRSVAYRCARMTAIRIVWPVAASGRTTPPAEHSASLFLAPKSHIDGPEFNMNGNHVTRRKAARRASFHRRQAAPTFPGCVRGIPGEARTVRAQRVPQPRKEYPVRVHPATVTPRRS